MLLFARLFGALWICSLFSVAAASTLTVGPPGSGARFDQLQDAIDAALAGDVILVQPGTYSGISVSKPLRILGDGTGTVLIDSTEPVGVMIENIPAGGELVLSAVQVQGTPSFATGGCAVLVSNCSGTVILHDVTVDTAAAQTGIRVENCIRAVVFSCRLEESGTNSTAAVSASSSSLWIVDSEIVGRTPGDELHLLVSGSDAVKVEDAALHVWRSTLVGGDGNSVSLEAFGAPALGGAGVAADNSTVNLFGGPVGQISGGDGGLAPFVGVSYDGRPSVDLTNGSSALIQAAIPLPGGFDGMGIVQASAIEVDGTSSFVLDPLVSPTLATDTQEAGIGTALTLSLAGNPSSVQAVFLSLGSGPDVTLPGLAGIGFIDVNSLFLIAVVSLDPTGALGLPTSVPAHPAFIGQTLFLQSLESFDSRISISNPVLVTVTN